MNFITKLDYKKTEELVKNNRLSGVYIIPLKEEIVNSLKDYLEENTGFNTSPVMGLTKVLGSSELKDVWDDLSSIVPLKEGDFVLQFNMPSDMVATMSLDDLIELTQDNNPLDTDDLLSRVGIDDFNNDRVGVDDNEVAFASILKLDFCTAYFRVEGDWDKSECVIESPNKLKTSTFFGGGI